MSMNLNAEIEALQQMTVHQLQDRYIDVFGERTRSNHKQYLIKRIAWRMQAQHEGDLSTRARRRAMELADDADLRVRPPAESPSSAPEDGDITVQNGIDAQSTDDRLPMPGTTLSREYKGRTILVRVLRRGFEYEGKVYRSLSAVAKAVTGSHWNGYHFFQVQPTMKNGGTA
ncbi:MAG TPA: DUF2924 domain-containing protein [Phycisphaerales bacterium]|nr:DUF2924 domain-containing protein [Phycisphaerales bacterium]